MKRKTLKSLSIRLPLLFIASVLVIMAVVLPLVYLRFYNRMIDQYTRMAQGVTQLMVNAFDGDRADEYMEKNFELPEYRSLVDYFYTLRDNYPDILYMYVYRFEEDGGHVIIDLDADWWENGEGYEPGTIYELEEPFTSHLAEVMEGKQIAGYSELTREDGYLFTYTRPIFRSDGSYACTACVDFSMDYLSGMDIAFTLRLALILLGIGVLVLFLDIHIVRKRITKPINALSQCAGQFAYETEADRENNIRLVDELNIRTGDEIEDVYRVLQSVTHDSFRVTSDLSRALSDIQERDRALTEALTRAEDANQAKTAFLSSMSHEIRTPMNAIIGLDNIALHDPNLSPETRDELEKIGASARHLLSLINDILDMSRIESGRMELKEETFSFRDFLDQISTIVGGQCRDKGLDFVCERTEPIDDWFIGDDLRLKQILINILGNAVKFTDAPGSVRFTAAQEAASDDRALLCFRIQDTGIGMDADFLPRLFEPFSQEDATTTNRYGGSGLGMAITKNMVDLMGGSIEVESEKGRGTVFTVKIPLRKAEDARPSAPAEHLAEPGASLEGLHVMIAEDVPLNAEVLSDLLEMEDISCEWAENGKRAMELFEQSEAGHFDAILMDMRMPVMDGLTATREIRKLERADAKSIPIIALTANAFEEDVKNCLEAGMNAHLSKPVDVDRLKEMLSGMLSRHTD
jgi:signal transduction histidine kinase